MDNQDHRIAELEERVSRLEQAQLAGGRTRKLYRAMAYVILGIWIALMAVGVVQFVSN